MSSSIPSKPFTVLVTGANSGLGLATCQRLIDEFLDTRPPTSHLLLIPTTRSLRKSEETVETLFGRIKAAAQTISAKRAGNSADYESRIHLHPEQVDLCALRSVRELSRRLNGSDEIDKIDVVICNAGIGGWTGIDWQACIWAVLTDLVHAITWPTYKKTSKGSVTTTQLPQPISADGSVGGKSGVLEESDAIGKREPELGKIFCSNVFGHYMMVHKLLPLLQQGGDSGSAGRAIWVSSLEAYASSFDPADFQCLRSGFAYESSKRLTDILVLTSHLPSTAPWVSGFLDTGSLALSDAKSETDSTTVKRKQKPKMYLTHPGVCGTSILPLPLLLTYIMVGVFHVARVLGSIWHTITPYTGATAPVWLALASESTLDQQEAPHPAQIADAKETILEAKRAAGKWGSATDADGQERVERTEVEGWGWSGRAGESSVRRLRGRMRGAQDLTREAREEFEDLGKTCWQEMERLRGVWEGLLDEAEV